MPESKEFENIRSAKIRRGRVNAVQQARRRVLVEELMLKRLRPREIAEVKDGHGKKLGHYQTILQDIKIIQSEWLTQDPRWFNRVRLARIKASKTIEGLMRNIVAFMEKNKNDLSLKEWLASTELIGKFAYDLYEIEEAMDPEEYIDKVIQAKAEAERIQNIGTRAVVEEAR